MADTLPAAPEDRRTRHVLLGIIGLAVIVAVASACVPALHGGAPDPAATRAAALSSPPVPRPPTPRSATGAPLSQAADPSVRVRPGADPPAPLKPGAFERVGFPTRDDPQYVRPPGAEKRTEALGFGTTAPVLPSTATPDTAARLARDLAAAHGQPVATPGPVAASRPQVAGGE